MQNRIIGSDLSELKSIGSNNNIINCKFIGSNIQIGNNCTIKNATIADGTEITDSYIENSLIGKDCVIGPFARIRPNSNIGNGCRVGNFVEIKNSQLGENTKVAHLSYIGDAFIGKNTNIGCGVVFANYNGVSKKFSVVGENCFIGSNVNIVAPVNVADNSYICAGTTLTKDTSVGDFIIGRVKEEKKEKYSFYLKKLKEISSNNNAKI